MKIIRKEREGTCQGRDVVNPENSRYVCVLGYGGEQLKQGVSVSGFTLQKNHVENFR